MFAFYSLCLKNGVIMTPKRRLLTLTFACLVFPISSINQSLNNFATNKFLCLICISDYARNHGTPVDKNLQGTMSSVKK